jgi:hypothetical protein
MLADLPPCEPLLAKALNGTQALNAFPVGKNLPHYLGASEWGTLFHFKNALRVISLSPDSVKDVIVDLGYLFQMPPSGPVSSGVEEQRAIGEVAGRLPCDAHSVLPSRAIARRDISGVGAYPRKLACAVALLIDDGARRLGEACVVDAVPDHLCDCALPGF